MVLPVVVRLRTESRRYSRIGSAFLAAPDAVVTSYHVIIDAEEVRLVLPGGQRIVTRKVWAVDPRRDVAVLHVDPELVREAGLVPLQVSPTGSVRDPADEGQNVAFTYGWPGGVQRSSVGVVYRGLELQADRQIWVTSNPVRPGDSGGPLLDASGRVIGVVTSGSITTGEADVLREEATVAADPRPALAHMRIVGKPRSLRSFWRNPDIVEQPHARALRASLLLSTSPVGLSTVAEAVEELDAVLDTAPGEAGLHFMRGSIEDMLGHRAAAVAAYRRALDLSGDYFPAALMLGLHSLRQDRYAEAEQLFRRVQATGAYRHLAAYGLAQTYVHGHAYGRAVAELQQVLQYDPAYAPAYFYLAYTYVALGEEEWARQLHARLLEIDPFWAGRLRQVLRTDVFRPHLLRELPRVPIPRMEDRE